MFSIPMNDGSSPRRSESPIHGYNGVQVCCYNAACWNFPAFEYTVYGCICMSCVEPLVVG